MIPAMLESALSYCDIAGLTLTLDGDAVAVTGGVLPPETRQTLKSHKPVLVQLLTRDARTPPALALYTTLRLETCWSPLTTATLIDPDTDRTYYRLTPHVLCWVGRALDRRWGQAAAPIDPKEVADCTATMRTLYDYVYRHYRSDQCVRAMIAPKLPGK